MMLNEKAAANAAGVLGAVYYLACYLIASVTPGLYKAVALTWFHMVDFGSLWRDVPRGFGLGIISFTLASWVTGYVFAMLYNKLTKK